MNWHLLAAALAAAAGLGGSSGATPPAEAPQIAAVDDDLPGTEVFDLEGERFRRMTVPVTIGDEGPFRFMIDTGAQATVLSRDLADRLELNDRETAMLVGMASRRQVETTAVSDFGLGNRRFYIQVAPLVEAGNIGDADGILGLDSLQNQRVLLDFEKEKIAVADAEDLGGNKGYDIIVKARNKLGQLIITEAKLNGVPVSVIVDTGAQGSVGNMALLDRLRRTRHLGEVEMTDVNGVEMSGPVKVARELVVGRASLANFAIMFADSPTFKGLGLAEKPALILGMSELKLFRRVAIDFKTRRVLFDMPPRAANDGRYLARL